MESTELEYVGFWLRVWASIIDTLLIALILAPLLTVVYGTGYWTREDAVTGPADFLISYVAPAIAVIAFWVARQATPGKMLISARIVDAETGDIPTTAQMIGRYMGYFVSMIPFFMGILWVAFDRRKQGWHDKLAGTVVVRPKRQGVQPVSFTKG